MKKLSPILIFVAGALWGAMGIFVDVLTELGFSTLQSSALRIATSAVMFVVFLAIYDRRLLRIKLRDFPIFFGLGILSILAMSCFYFLAIKETSYSVAAILLYTAPIIVSVLSAILFKEKFDRFKLTALVVAFVGCVLVSGVGDGDGTSPNGLFFGLMSGLAYALYSIFGKFALEKYHPYTVSAYSFVFATAGAIFVCDVPGIVGKVTQVEVVPFVAATVLSGLVSGFLPYILYTYGLNNVEPGRAAIISSAEPLSAAVFGLLRGQTMGVGTAVGIVCILAAAILAGRSKTHNKCRM